MDEPADGYDEPMPPTAPPRPAARPLTRAQQARKDAHESHVRATVKRHLKGLAPVSRLIVLLYLVDGLSDHEITAALGPTYNLTPNEVGSRRRALMTRIRRIARSTSTSTPTPTKPTD